ncbi:relaxase/mobilization nuclease RlxS [Hephaestia sp. GCM10023244]|uniref:relaxase/mobilization nuclease RlxS n=1 Tax=unclassified Hephaestia TaxID=2631281 RepID=UPI002076F5AF|nr:relaxase/mobilization nuclease and DUF3363 domain-containing protein [Hephaestia sp. MAHUQ-44]
MAVDDDFEPRLGRLRAQPGQAGRRYLKQVLHARARAGGRKPHRKGFNGSRIGRGAVAARLLGSRDRFAAYRQRRVMVKTRIIAMGTSKAMDAARAHLSYIRREGVTRDGQPGQLYGAEHDKTDGRTFLDRQAGDRHQFRFIVSPEDGAEYQDLKSLTRRVMAQMETDLGTRLDWVAVDHFNTGHPHTHILLRGKTERGADLIIAPEYLTAGLRERAAELVKVDLGPRTDIQIEDRLRREMDQERLTSIDRRLLRDMDDTRTVSSVDHNPFHQTLRAGRLRKLAALGLAQDAGTGRWRLAEGIEDTLRRMGERGDIIRTLQRAFTRQAMVRAPRDIAIADPTTMSPLVGRVVERGLSEEAHDRHYLIIDATDGRTHYVDIGRGTATGLISRDAVVKLSPTPTEPRASDRAVIEIAAANGGRYSIDLHLRHEPSATERFAQSHVRRLEAIRRMTGGVERESDGTWIIAPDHLERAAAYELKRARAAPVAVDLLSSIPLEQQITADGATWLDRELLATSPEARHDSGFGADVVAARARRQQWLINQGLAAQDQDRIVYREDLLTVLRQRELRRVAGGLAKELGLGYAEARMGDRIQGVYRRPIELASGRYAVIEKAREFTLVPWRPVLEGHAGEPVSGIMRRGGVSWTIGRDRGGPSVS